MTVDDDLSFVVWTWLSAAAHCGFGSCSEQIIHFIIKIKLKYVQGLKEQK